VGVALQRLSAWLPLRGRGTDDFQDLALWRRSVGFGIRVCKLFARGPVLVPMAFSNLSYLDEVLRDLGCFYLTAGVFCLTADTETIRERVRRRGTDLQSPSGLWLLRRIDECAAAHADPRFGEPIPADRPSAAELAEKIMVRCFAQK
jgi:hypothetical protein